MGCKPLFLGYAVKEAFQAVCLAGVIILVLLVSFPIVLGGLNAATVKRGFKSEEEAIEWESSFSKADSENMSMKFSQFMELYVEDMKPRLRETTWNTKMHMVDKKILPFFGDMSMDEITTIDVIRWQNEIMAERGPKGKGYSETYLRSVNNQLNAIFNHAVRYYGLPKSPCARVEKAIILSVCQENRPPVTYRAAPAGGARLLGFAIT